MFQSLLYHSNRYAVDLSLGGVDDMGGATVTHVFGSISGCATAMMIYKTFPGFEHPDHQPRYVSGLYARSRAALQMQQRSSRPPADTRFGAACGCGWRCPPTTASWRRTTCGSGWC